MAADQTAVSKKKHHSLFVRVVKGINRRVAVWITLGVSSIWAFYVFVLFGLTPLVWPSHEENILYWSNFLQLIFLPIITVGAAILGYDAEQRAKEDHDHICREFLILKDMIEVMNANHKLLVEHDILLKDVKIEDGEVIEDTIIEHSERILREDEEEIHKSEEKKKDDD